uniref:Uncharacterized protein n=1 Tax=Anguilla anguilla TaxID=7936 RepID=A0A0E9RTD8_ANGAN
MTGRLLFTSHSNTSTSELLKFFLHLESGAPPSLDFRLGIIDFVRSQLFCSISVCAHGPAVSCPFMGIGGRLPMLIRYNWHALYIYEDDGIHHFKNTCKQFCSLRTRT